MLRPSSLPSPSTNQLRGSAPPRGGAGPGPSPLRHHISFFMPSTFREKLERGGRSSGVSTSPSVPQLCTFTPMSVYESPNFLPSPAFAGAPTSASVSASADEDDWQRRGTLSKLPRLALRRSMARHLFRHRPRHVWLAFFVASLVCYIALGPRRYRPEVVDRARNLVAEHHCRMLGSYTPGCLSGSFSKGRFGHLEYTRSHGLLFHPAVLASDSAESGRHVYVEDDLDTSANVSKPSHHSRPTFSPTSQPHPIHLLIEQAEQQWRDKLARQSRSLDEAVAEYRHRYDQAPPKGFDLWYEFAVKNDVQLIDEYDSIYERILPFASIPSAVLRQRSEMLQNDENLWLRGNGFTVHIKDHGQNISVDGPMSHLQLRTGQVVEFLRNIAPYLPDVNLTITGHDTPWVVISGQQKQKHIAAALEKRYLEEDELLNFGDDPSFDGWATACPPHSPMRRARQFADRLEWKPRGVDALIEDHVDSMDVCYHPENQAIHGFISWPGPRPGLLFPMFSFTTSHLHSDLLMPALEQFDRPVGHDPEWKDKTKDKVVWRGSTTGSDLSIEHMRKWSQRPRLCKMGESMGDITVPLALNDKPGHPRPTTPYTASSSALAKEYFDFQYMGHPQQCGNVETCKAFEAEFKWAAAMNEKEQNEYKYVMDVDGNGWSGRFHRLMASNSLVLKSTIFPEWYAERIQPWYHYVPVNVDYTDLYTILAFFKGDLEGRGAHDQLAEKIAQQGKQWTEENWTWSSMQAYFFRLILEYIRVMERDPQGYHSMDYEGSSSTRTDVS